jgi:NAD(P)-dependent dehydrogenase (short-subunit alcohol dehydrogenase family)
MSGVLVVTGGSRGIGAAVCRLGAERGYAVCVNYVGQAARATEVVQAIQSRGGMAIAVQGDVSREDDVERLFGTVDRELGRVTALVNNAGVGPGLGGLEEIDSRDIRRTFEVNVIGVTA